MVVYYAVGPSNSSSIYKIHHSRHRNFIASCYPILYCAKQSNLKVGTLYRDTIIMHIYVLSHIASTQKEYVYIIYIIYPHKELGPTTLIKIYYYTSSATRSTGYHIILQTTSGLKDILFILK